MKSLFTEDETACATHHFYCLSSFSHSQTQTNNALANVLLLQKRPPNVNLAQKSKSAVLAAVRKPQAYLNTSVKLRSLGSQRMELISVIV